MIEGESVANDAGAFLKNAANEELAVHNYKSQKRLWLVLINNNRIS